MSIRNQARARIAVAVASVGRAETLRRTIPLMLAQSTPPVRLILSVVAPEDAAGVADIAPTVEILYGPKGASSQRNTALAALKGTADLVTFFDDDFVPSRLFLERSLALFQRQPELVALTGHLLDDGINHGGLDFDASFARVRAWDADPAPLEAPCFDINHVYGCNMTLDVDVAEALRFDDRLPLYSWQEDRDLSARMRAHGAVRRSHALSGIHLGVTRGRTSGRKLGYAQVANPLYLWRKGTMRAGETAALISRNVAANLVKSFKPEPWVDRAGRLEGNLRALADALSGRAKPERMLEL